MGSKAKHQPFLGFAKRYSRSYWALTIQTVLSRKSAELLSESLQGPTENQKIIIKINQIYMRKLHKK